MNRKDLVEKLKRDPRYAGVVAAAGEGRRNRDGNMRCVGEAGEVFDSRLERRVIEGLGREGRTVIRQVSMPVVTAPGRRAVRLRVDGLEVIEARADGTFVGRFLDAKGHMTDEWKIKALAFRERYGVGIVVVRRDGSEEVM